MPSEPPGVDATANATPFTMSHQIIDAVCSSNHALLHSLFASGANPDLKDEDGDCILTLATRRKDTDSVILLLNAGANVNNVNSNGTTALTWVQDVKTAKILLERGANMEAEVPEDGMASLHMLASEGNVDVLNLMLQLPGAAYAIERFDDLERSPLACAVESKEYDCAVSLLKAGADVNAVDRGNLGRPPIYWAVNAGDQRMVSLLMSHGADPTIKLGLNESPLELAKQLGRHEILQLLCKP